MGSQASAAAQRVPDQERPWDEVIKGGLGVTKKQGSSLYKLERQASAGADDLVHVSCVVQGFKKDQDRFVCVPDLLTSPRVLFSGVFDGHGRDGDIVAETVAVTLPRKVREKLLAAAKDAGFAEAAALPGGRIPSDIVKKAIVDAYAEVQSTLDTEFERDVVQPTLKLKAEIEAAQKVPLGELTLPLGSGSTATTFLLNSGVMYVGHVGDSRAILARRKGDGTLHAEDLTKDQNVASSSPEEIRRIKESGGSLCGRHLAGDYIDGMLQLTHSLGDVPLHRQGIVMHEPIISWFPITDDMLFAIAASDGLWDHYSSAEVSQFVFDNAKKLAAKAKTPVHKIMMKVAQELQTQCAARAAEKGHQSDDTSILILTLGDEWLHAAPNASTADAPAA